MTTRQATTDPPTTEPTTHRPTPRPRARHAVVGAVVSLLLATWTVQAAPSVASAPAGARVLAAAASTPLTVAQAVAAQDGRSAPVRGYVVGQPTSSATVVRSGFPGDTALALADSAAETATSRMLYVQVPTQFRATYGLRTNPSLMGRRIDVTGVLTAYFTHPGLKSPTAFAPADGGGGTVPGPYDDTYYKSAVGTSGEQLRDALHDIVAAQTTLTYDQVWEALKATDQDPNNSANVVLLYSGRSQSKATNGGGVDDWNREHVWAKSHGDFGTAVGPGTDLHHLRPEDVTVNSTRGNKDFDTGGAVVTEAPGNLTDADSWEPRDAVKGDVARMLFYMAVRYEGDDGRADLELNDSVLNGTRPFMGRLTVLRQWHAQDPPDAFERRRNDVIHTTYQHNRNPFVDHPEWVASVFG